MMVMHSTAINILDPDASMLISPLSTDEVEPESSIADMHYAAEIG